MATVIRDLVAKLHSTRRELLPTIIGGAEETTTGIHRLRAMESEGKLNFPMMAVNVALCKHLFDNRYETGQSVWDGIMRTTNLLVAGKPAVVIGYGWCGKSVAMRAKGLGARVIVCEIDPIKSAEAWMDGFEVMKLVDAAPKGDFFVTVTGCTDVIRQEHIEKLKEGAVLANASHFDVEISKGDLSRLADSEEEVRKNIRKYALKDGRSVYLIAGGRLVNLAAGDGHPAEIMDMTFSLQASSLLYLNENPKLEGRVYTMPEELDRQVAQLKLASLDIEIDELTPAQKSGQFKRPAPCLKTIRYEPIIPLLPIGNALSRTAIGKGIYLTGGTCLSRFYREKRYSDDLDFFSNDSPRFAFALRNIISALKGSMEVEIRVETKNFTRLVADHRMQVDFVNDLSYRMGEPHLSPEGYLIDGVENILSNKLTAVIVKPHTLCSNRCMKKFFNTAGPINQPEHYKVDPLRRWDLEEILMMFEQRKYFILHAPRQTGKTSSLLALEEYLNKEGRYAALYTNVENAQAARNDIAEGIGTIISGLARRLWQDREDLRRELLSLIKSVPPTDLLSEALSRISRNLNRPFVLFIDEIDALVGDTLVSVLRQLRSGYDKRPEAFPSTVILCGVRDIKDYRIHRSNDDIITGGSALTSKQSLCGWETSAEKISGIFTASTPRQRDSNLLKSVSIWSGTTPGASPGW